MKRERRTMKCGERYVIEEKIDDGLWATVSECATINEAKEILRSLRVLEGEEKDG